MTVANRVLKGFRFAHLYLGAFTAPMLLFLAFTGLLQSGNLHEVTRGSRYQPPAWVVRIAHLHKKQSVELPAAHKPAAVAGQAAPAKSGPPPAPLRVWPMKLFFVLVAFSLMTSVITGVYMGWRSSRARRRYGTVLAAGALLPTALMLL